MRLKWKPVEASVKASIFLLEETEAVRTIPYCPFCPECGCVVWSCDSQLVTMKQGPRDSQILVLIPLNPGDTGNVWRHFGSHDLGEAMLLASRGGGQGCSTPFQHSRMYIARHSVNGSQGHSQAPLTGRESCTQGSSWSFKNNPRRGSGRSQAQDKPLLPVPSAQEWTDTP